jgi:hypothetical protein
MDGLRSFIAEETAQPVHEAVNAMAEAIMARHGAARAVLFYGACLRDGAKGPPEDGLLDFYMLVERYGDIHDGWFAAAANRLLPPNVYVMEVSWQGRTLRAKYAVISLGQFAHGASPRCIQPMIWARFCQPARLVHAHDEGVRQSVIDSLTDAVMTMVGNCGPGEEPWVQGFTETYRCELRPEGAERARRIYAADAERYDRLTMLAKGGNSGDNRSWIVRRLVGKLLNGARLIKALFTYRGALGYALWKTRRHAGAPDKS